MTEEPRLFYESWPEALRDDIAAIGGTKAVGAALWPEKSVDAARRTLNDCLNAERRERLSDEQERWIMRRARDERGFSAGIAFLCDECGFGRPVAITKGEQKADLQRQTVDAVRQLRGLVRRLEQLDGGTPGADT